MFFVTNLHYFVWVKMWVSGLTHTVTHTGKCSERFRKHRAGSLAFLPGILLFILCWFACYITCVMKLPMVSAAWSCICRVA